ncbi:MAG: 4-hydroxybenzoate polyprenyltransferase [Chloroflexi bacterium]|nr:MAG: 4-hydroxybenzoate polyprenyltransferase [Chloroflexota bacterium]
MSFGNIEIICDQALFRLKEVPAAIKFEESIFALPFAYTGMILASNEWPDWMVFLWITLAMVGGRTLGMAANRLIDRKIDSSNPRSATRHLPKGTLKQIDMIVLIALGFALLMGSASQLNQLSLILAPVAAIYLICQPYFKRFTWMANPLLGWALAIAPSAAWIGVTGKLTWEPALLSLAVAMWAGSFDIIYHAQDLDFHLKEKLHSVVASIGVSKAFHVAKLMDGIAIVCLLILGLFMSLDWPYFVGAILAGLILIFKYRVVSPSDVSKIGMTFYRINAYVSLIVFIGTLIAVLI